MSTPEMLDPLPIRRTLVPAAGATLPVTSAPNSVFAAGARAKAAARVPYERIAFADIVLHKGVAMPPLRGGVAGGYRALLDRMEAGTHFELPLKQARALMSASKKFAPSGAVYCFRKLTDTMAGIWRTA